jgi:hypothetical protein
MARSTIDGGEIVKEFKQAMYSVQTIAMRRAIHWSSGTFSKERLAKLGHPYSVRNANGWVPYNTTAKINMQSRRFISSWKFPFPRMHGDSITGSVFNTVYYRKDLEEGIPNLTKPRPLMKKVVQGLDVQFERRIVVAFRNAIQKMR